MKEPLIFMFSGQGAQYFHMGRELLRKEPFFRNEIHRLDEIASQWLQTSIADAIYSDSRSKFDTFDHLPLTHPAIFVVQYALVKLLEHRGFRADSLLGVSLGMYVAATTAKCLDEEKGIELVVKQAAIVNQLCIRGGMVAILAEPMSYEHFPELRENCEVAGINFSSHFVVSAPTDKLNIVEGFLRKGEIAYHRLPVGFPFHSRWMDDLKVNFFLSMRDINFKQPQKKLICCASAAHIDELSVEKLWEAIRQPIRFQQTIEALEQIGKFRYVDLGPSGTLATFVKYILPKAESSRVFSVMSPFGDESANLAKLSL